MENTKKSDRSQPSPAIPSQWLRYLIVVLLIIGIFFRFGNLGGKVYWIDETYTSLRLSGYTESEFIQQVVDGQVRDITYLQKYQRINPEKTVLDTVKGLAVEEPQLAPLYFIATRFWVQLFGDSVAVTRSMSAVFSLLALPCMYWLCWELFDSSLTAWLAVALLAVSPFQIVYAQEARPYSLFVLVILLSSAALLRGMRLKTHSSWAIYAVTVAAGFYTHLLFVMVGMGHFIYVEIIEKLRFNKTVIAYLLASITGFIAFSPWTVVYLQNANNASDKTGWQSFDTPLTKLVVNWALNIARQFFDLGTYSNLPLGYSIAAFPVIFMSLVIVGSAFYWLRTHSPKRIWLFVATLTGVTVAIFLPADLIGGGKRSINTRYMIPCYLGMQIAVAYFFAAKITYFSATIQLQKLWRLAFAAVISIGIISCCIYLPADSWWNKDRSYIYIPIAHKINSTSEPLIVADLWQYSVDAIGNLLGLSYRLNPQTKFLVLPPQRLEIPPNFNEIFLYGISSPLKAEIDKKSHYEIESLYPLQNGDIMLGKLRTK